MLKKTFFLLISQRKHSTP
uniref:Uncharacterized protein n=1 Tax=Rhizophora mucronata TaxID=61149 RepID=A0A2P2PG85_RHIMU